MKRGVILVAIATCLVGLGAVGTAIAESRHSSSPPRLPHGFARQMTEMAITYSDVSAVSGEVRSTALHAAAKGESPIAGKDARAIVVQVKFTDNGYRDHGRRLYADRAALMLIYPDQPMALGGPPGGIVRSTFVDFIDPGSFRYLRALSFATSTHVDRPTG